MQFYMLSTNLLFVLLLVARCERKRRETVENRRGNHVFLSFWPILTRQIQSRETKMSQIDRAGNSLSDGVPHLPGEFQKRSKVPFDSCVQRVFFDRSVN